MVLPLPLSNSPPITIPIVAAHDAAAPLNGLSPARSNTYLGLELMNPKPPQRRGLFRIDAECVGHVGASLTLTTARSPASREDFATRSASRRQNRAKTHNSCG
jgi:hypothetical protein